MKARIKFYEDLFDACNDKEASFVTMYADTKAELIRVVDCVSDKFTVVNVFIDDGKKEDKAE